MIQRNLVFIKKKGKQSFKSLLNSSTIDELGEGAWKDGG